MDGSERAAPNRMSHCSRGAVVDLAAEIPRAMNRACAARRIAPGSPASPRRDDPTGIRTLVTALKGPCPRPLDDGAVSGTARVAGVIQAT